MAWKPMRPRRKFPNLPRAKYPGLRVTPAPFDYYDVHCSKAEHMEASDMLVGDLVAHQTGTITLLLRVILAPTLREPTSRVSMDHCSTRGSRWSKDKRTLILHRHCRVPLCYTRHKYCIILVRRREERPHISPTFTHDFSFHSISLLRLARGGERQRSPRIMGPRRRPQPLAFLGLVVEQSLHPRSLNAIVP